MGDRGADDVRDDLGDERLGARPYQAAWRRSSPTGDHPVREDTGVRPYLLTGGRTRSSNALVGFETMVILTEVGNHRRMAEASERRDILDRCGRPISVVELSAHLRLPLGVAQVLAGDLADEGCLQVYRAPEMPSRDRDLLERLAAAVRRKQMEVA